MVRLHNQLHVRLFCVTTLVIIVAQCWYGYSNIKNFQEGYVQAVRSKCVQLGEQLREDIEMVVAMRVPLAKLRLLENSLAHIVEAAPELDFAEVRDGAGVVLFRADRHGASAASGMHGPETAVLTSSLLFMESANAALEIALPLRNTVEGGAAGVFVMRLSAEDIIARTRAMAMDMLTVIVTSLLVMFELLLFIAAYSVGHPLQHLAWAAHEGASRLRPIEHQAYVLDEMLDLVTHFNAAIKSNAQAITERRGKLHERWRELCVQAREVEEAAKRAGMRAIEKASGSIASYYESSLRDSLPDTPVKKPLPYAYIRIVVFFFLVADGLCISFMPLFVKSLYEPVLGLSKESVISLPISLFFFALAVAMPVAGKVMDTIDWHRPLLVGIALNAVGLLATGFVVSLWQLVFCRIVTAVGFGLAFIACQKYVLDNTTERNRTQGLAAFLAAFFGGDIGGTVMGGILAERVGYRGVFVVSACIALVAWVLAATIFRRDHVPSQQKGPVSLRFPLREMGQAIKDVDLAALVFFQAIPAKVTLVGFLYYFVPLYLASLGTTQADTGRIIMIYGVLMVALGPVGSRFFDVPAKRWLYVVSGGLLTGVALCSFLFVNGALVLAIVVMLIGVAHSFSVSSQAAIVAATPLASKLGSGTCMGMYRLWERVGNVVGPFIVGYCITQFGFEVAAVCVGLLSLLGSCLYFLFTLWRRRSGVAHQHMDTTQGVA